MATSHTFFVRSKLMIKIFFLLILIIISNFLYNSNHLLINDLLFSTTIYCDNILEESKFSAKEGKINDKQ